MAAKETSPESTRIGARHKYAGEFFDGPVDPADLDPDEVFWMYNQGTKLADHISLVWCLGTLVEGSQMN